MKEKALKYSDILLIPKMSILSSRNDANTSVFFANKKWKLPVIPANMKSIINFKLAEWLSRNEYFYILDRFCGYDTILDWIQNNQDIYLSISLGVKDVDKCFIRRLIEKGLKVDCITLDIAAGHSLLMKYMLTFVKKQYKKKCPFIIAGNVATPEAVKDLIDWGADAVKVGIGQGSICTTRFQTGFSIPMFSCVQDCSNHYFWNLNGKYTEKPKIPIIADGGVETIGDIPKALIAGADMVMCGNLFAGCKDSPAKLDDKGEKIYFGSTSFEAKNHRDYIEGKSISVKLDISYSEKLEEIKQALQSAISYAGGKDVSAFKSVECLQI